MNALSCWFFEMVKLNDIALFRTDKNSIFQDVLCGKNDFAATRLGKYKNICVIWTTRGSSVHVWVRVTNHFCPLEMHYTQSECMRKRTFTLIAKVIFDQVRGGRLLLVMWWGMHCILFIVSYMFDFNKPRKQKRIHHTLGFLGFVWCTIWLTLISAHKMQVSA